MSTFCPECGVENADGESRCSGCGRDLDLGTEGAPSPSRPTRWLAAGILAATSVFTVLVNALLGLSLVVEPYVFPPAEESSEPLSVLVVEGSAFVALVPMSGFVIGALLVAFLFRGRYLREVSLGATAGALAQVVVWMVSLGSDAGLFLTADLLFLTEGGGARVLALMVLLFFPLLFVFAALTTAVAGCVVLEQVTGKALCLHCRALHRIRPTPPPSCPSCHVSLETDAVQWPWVMAAGVVTAVAFGLVMTYAGKPLSFFYHCDPFDLDEACRAAIAAARESSSWAAFRDARDRSDAHLLVFNQWRYVGFSALLMMLGPAVLGLVLRRGSRASSGVAIVVDWAAATVVAIVVVARSGGYEGVYLWLFRLHALALIAWGISGFIGAMIGYALRSRVNVTARDSRLSLAPMRDSSHTPVPTEKALDDAWAISNRRRRLVLGLVLSGVLLVGGGAVGLWVALTPDPRCDREQVQALLDHPEIPASAVYEVCELPAPLADTLRSVEASPPELRPLLAMRLATQAPDLIRQACPAYARALTEVAAVPPRDKPAVFWRHCDLSELGLVQSDIDGDALGDVVLAMAVYGALHETDGWAAQRLAQRIVRGR